MKYLFFLLCTLATIALTAQTSLSTFEKVSLTGNVHVTFIKGDTEQYEVTGDTEGLKVKVEHGKLKISRTDVFKDWDNPTEVKVWYVTIRSLYSSAGAKFRHEGTMHAGDLELNVDTGASGDLTVDAQSLEVSVGEGGVLRLDGSGRTLEASASTGAVLKASDFVAQTVYAKANTGATCNVHATKTLEANATLGGFISYNGNPEEVKVKESLGGTVRG